MTVGRPRVFRLDDAGRQGAVDVLRAGGIVALPTDTVYGIGVALSTPGGVERLFEVKSRPPDKAISVLVEDLAQVTELVGLPPAAAALASLWPGGLTLVLPLLPRVELPLALTAGTTTLGVRIADHQIPRYLARAVGPLPTTSANRSGQPDARSADEVIASLGDRIDAVVDGGPSPGGVPSTVLDCTTPTVRVLRSGAISVARIAALLDAAGIPHELDTPGGEASAGDQIVGR